MARYTISTSNYSKACQIIDALTVAGFYANITAGGVGVSIDSPDALNAAQCVVAPFGERIECGETRSETFRQAWQETMRGKAEE